MKLKDLKKYNLPESSGVYFFMRSNSNSLKANGRDEILYIGKATNLKDRVKSYFGKDLINTRGPLIVDMVFKADNIRWQETDTVLEALIKEANEIKKYQPYYNTKEKDDKSFNYVYITTNYKLGIIRGRELLNLQKTKNLKSSFSNGLVEPKATRGPEKKEFLSFLKVFGPFPNGGQLREALKIIRKFFPYIEDRKGAKGKEEFYKQIKLNPESVEENKKNIKNIILFFEGKKKRIITLFKKEMQSLARKRKFEEANEIKKKIFALEHINDIALIKEEIEFGNKIFDPAPFFGRIKGDKAGPSDTKILLSNLRFNIRIEAYDIAHLSGKNMVGVMVLLEDGELNKSKYRKFKIKNQDWADDTKALKEVLERRLNHKEWEFPNVIIVDGGIAQINVAERVLKERKLNIKVLSVLKNEKHKPKSILFSPRSDLNGAQASTFIKKYKKEILLLNNEAHRFAIKYHKQMRNKNFLKN